MILSLNFSIKEAPRNLDIVSPLNQHTIVKLAIKLVVNNSFSNHSGAQSTIAVTVAKKTNNTDCKLIVYFRGI